jgi:hypothetical protein
MAEVARLLGAGIALVLAAAAACSNEDRADPVSSAGAGGNSGLPSAGSTAGGQSGASSAGTCEPALSPLGQGSGSACVPETLVAERVAPCRYRVAIPDAGTYESYLLGVTRQGNDGKYAVNRGSNTCCEPHGWYAESQSDGTVDVVLCTNCCDYLEHGDLEFEYGCMGIVVPVIC